jgi:hypothetical protein
MKYTQTSLEGRVYWSKKRTQIMITQMILLLSIAVIVLARMSFKSSGRVSTAIRKDLEQLRNHQNQ